MKDYQNRVIEEKVELEIKIDRLLTFMKGEQFKPLPDDEKARLRNQCDTMQKYSSILSSRIAAFTP